MTTVINMNAQIAKPVFDIVETGNSEFVHQIPEAFHSGFIRGDGEANERTKCNFDGIARKLTELNVSHEPIISHLARSHHAVTSP